MYIYILLFNVLVQTRLLLSADCTFKGQLHFFSNQSSSIQLQIMTSRLALKTYRYALFYFPLDDTLEVAKTSKIVSSKVDVKEVWMTEISAVHLCKV